MCITCGKRGKLYPMGVNCLRMKMQYEPETVIQLDELITRPAENELPPIQKRIENPAFHLTAHFVKGTYIMAVQPDGKIPLLHKKMGEETVAFQPVFTDMAEFMKFNMNKQFNPLIMEMKKIPEVMEKEAKGVIVNPVGVNLVMGVEKK